MLFSGLSWTQLLDSCRSDQGGRFLRSRSTLRHPRARLLPRMEAGAPRAQGVRSGLLSSALKKVQRPLPAASQPLPAVKEARSLTPTPLGSARKQQRR